jgi:hypothetical protein
VKSLLALFLLLVQQAADTSVSVIKYYVSGYYTSRCLYCETQCFGDWILSPSSGKPTQMGPIERACGLKPWICFVLLLFFFLFLRRTIQDTLQTRRPVYGDSSAGTATILRIQKGALF